MIRRATHDRTRTRPKIAFVSAQLPSYFAAEHRVVERSIAELERRAQELDFELLAPWQPVTTREAATGVAHEAEAAAADMVLLQASSFAMGDVVLPFAGRPYRLGLWAVEEPTREGAIALNNLVAMHLHAGVLRLAAPGAPHTFKWFFGLGEHPYFGPRLATTVDALRAIGSLQSARIAFVGGLAPSFLNLGFDPRSLRARLGVEVVEHDLREVVERGRRAAPEAVARVVSELRAAAREVTVSHDDMARSAGFYLALQALAEEGEYRALAVSDWPVCQQELGIHPGMAFSWLDEVDGVPVAAEGDVVGAATMLLARGLSGQGAMLLDINDIDLGADALLMWHCGGSPLALADARGVRWEHHSTLGRKQPDAVPRGAVADLSFAQGPVTVLRLRRDGAELLALAAEVVPHPALGFSGSRGWVGRFADAVGPRTVGDVLHTMLARGIEHHLILARGARAAAARELAAWLGMELTAVLPYRDELIVPKASETP